VYENFKEKTTRTPFIVSCQKIVFGHLGVNTRPMPLIL